MAGNGLIAAIESLRNPKSLIRIVLFGLQPLLAAIPGVKDINGIFCDGV
jgi:hypothetical protein